MVLRKNNQRLSGTSRRRGGNSTTKLVVALTILIAAGLFAYGKLWGGENKKGAVSANGAVAAASLTGTSSLGLASSNISARTWTVMRDGEGVFEVRYPKSIFKRLEKPGIAPIKSQDKVRIFEISHAFVSSRPCVEAGQTVCSATTTDIAIRFFAVDRSFNTVLKELRSVHGDSLMVKTVAGHQGVQYEEKGPVPGEGVVYTVVPVDNARTLFIARTYFNEKAAPRGSSRSEGYITYAGQKDIFDQIMSTFMFRPGI